MKINKKLEISVQQFIVEVVAILLLLAFLIAFFIIYAGKGDTIAFLGTLEGLQMSVIKKSVILVLPIVSLLVFIIITFFQFYPSIWNLTKEDEKNKVLNTKILDCVKLMISYTKLLFIIVFTYISMMSIEGKLLGKWFIPSAIALAVLEIAFFIIRFVYLNKKYTDKIAEVDKSANDNE
jgi:hypothetical protein